MSTIITKDEQITILSTIRALCGADHLTVEDKDRRQHLLFLGVYIALGQRIPPHWQMNIMASRTDRIMEELDLQPTTRTNECAANGV